MKNNGMGDVSTKFLLHDLRQSLNMIILSCANIQNRALDERDSGGLSEDYVIARTGAIIASVRRAAEIIQKIEDIEQSR